MNSKGEKKAERPQLRALERDGTPDRTSTTLSIAAPLQPSTATAATAAVTAAATVAAPIPDPEVVERPRRRTFTAEFKRRVVEEADACAGPGAIGALLRRHGLYSSLLAEWRAQYRRGALTALTPKKRGPKGQERNPLAERLARVEREKVRLEQRLKRAELIIAVQKKVSELLGIPLSRPEPDEND
jgi:transposase-like protein